MLTSLNNIVLLLLLFVSDTLYNVLVVCVFLFDPDLKLSATALEVLMKWVNYPSLWMISR